MAEKPSRRAHGEMGAREGTVVHVWWTEDDEGVERRWSEDIFSLDWYPMGRAEAIAAARRQYPGCRILETYAMSAYDWEDVERANHRHSWRLTRAFTGHERSE